MNPSVTEIVENDLHKVESQSGVTSFDISNEDTPLVPSPPSLIQYQPLRKLNDDPFLSRCVLAIFYCFAPSKRFWFQGRSETFNTSREAYVAGFVSEFLRGYTFATDTVWPISLIVLLLTTQSDLLQQLCDTGPMLSGFHQFFFSINWWPLITLMSLPLVLGLLNGIKSLFWFCHLHTPSVYQNTWQFNRAEFSIAFEERYNFPQKKVISNYLVSAPDNQVLLKPIAIKTLVRALDHEYKKNQNQLLCKQEVEEKLIKLSYPSHYENFAKINALFTLYSLWRYGYFIQDNNRYKHWRSLLYIPFGLITLMQWLAKLIVPMALIEKIIQYKTTETPNTTCPPNQGTYQYLDQLAKYACAVCGDWQDVYILDRFSPQGCIDGTLRNSLPAQEIISRMKRITDQYTIDHTNFTQQNFNQWTKQEFDQLFSSMQSLASMNYVDVSQTTKPINQNRTNDMIQSFAKFLKNTKVKAIFAKRLGLTSDAAKPVAVSTSYSETSYLDFTDNQITDQIFTDLKQQHNSTLQDLILTNNKIQAEKIEHLNLPMLRQIILDKNPITQMGFDSLTRWFNNTHLNTFSISDVNVAQMQLEKFLISLARSSVTGVRISRCQLNGYQVYVIGDQAKHAKWQAVDLSHNPISTDNYKVLVLNFRNTTISKLNIENTELNQPVLDVLKDHIDELPFEDLNIAGNDFPQKTFVSFFKASQYSSLKKINAANNHLREEAAQGIKQVLMHNKQHYQALNFGFNNIPDQDAGDIIRLAEDSALKELSFRKNNLNRKTSSAIKSSLAKTQIERFDIAENDFDQHAAVDIGQGLRGSVVNSVDVSGNPFTPAGVDGFVAQLTDPILSPQAINYPTPSIQQRCVLNQTKPATVLNDINLENTQANTRSAGFVCELAPGSGVPMQNFHLGNNPIDSSLNTENCVYNYRFFPEERSTSVNQQSALGLTLCSYLLPFLLFVAALYLLYRAFKPLANYIFDKFTHNQDSQPEFQEGYQA